MNIISSTHTVVPSNNRARQYMQHHPLVCYFLMAFGFSWLAWIPYILSLDGFGLLPVHLTQLGILPGAYLGPLLSGLLMTAAVEGKPGIGRLLRRFVLWCVGLQWYLLILLGIPVTLFLGFLVMPGALTGLHFSLVQIAMYFPLLLIVEILTSGLAEEPGWRGFALPRLQERYGPLWGSVVLGFLWGCWHLPLFLTAWQSSAGILGICEFIVGTVGTAIVITWVFNHTRGSLLIAILFHATIDTSTSTAAAASLFPMQWMQKYEDLALCLCCAVIALLLIIVTRGRLGYKQVSSPPDGAQPSGPEVASGTSAIS